MTPTSPLVFQPSADTAKWTPCCLASVTFCWTAFIPVSARRSKAAAKALRLPTLPLHHFCKNLRKPRREVELKLSRSVATSKRATSSVALPAYVPASPSESLPDANLALLLDRAKTAFGTSAGCVRCRCLSRLPGLFPSYRNTPFLPTSGATLGLSEKQCLQTARLACWNFQKWSW